MNPRYRIVVDPDTGLAVQIVERTSREDQVRKERKRHEEALIRGDLLRRFHP